MPAMKASILPDRNAPLVVEEVTLDAPKTGGPGQDRGLRRLPLGPLRDQRHAPPAHAHRPRPRRSRRGGSRGPGLSWRPLCSRCPYRLRGQPYLCDLASRISLSGAMLDEMVTRTYKLSEVNQAFDDLRNGVNLRGVLVFS